MTFFEKLQLPPPAVVVKGEPSSEVTVGEAKDGLAFEIATSTKFFLFMLATSMVACVYFDCSFYIQTFSVIVFLGSSLVLNNAIRIFDFQIWLWITYLAVYLSPWNTPCVHRFFVWGGALTVIKHAGFHPTIRLFLHVPFTSPAVQTGLVLTSITLFAFFQIPNDEYKPVLAVACVCFVAMTAAFMAEAALVFYRTSSSRYRILAPWTDVVACTKNIFLFRIMTGVRMSVFVRVLEGEDDSELLSYKILEDWVGEDRGSSIWAFMVDWKQTRLGKNLSIEDELEQGIRKTSPPPLFHPDAPLRSPLLRGY
jgi:hypothetical protein